MPELVFFRRGEEVLRFNLDGSRVVLGRGEKCDVVIPDPDVSRQQAALTFAGDKCQLEDLSGKGTLAMGKKQSKCELPDGADVALGQWRAVFRVTSSATDEGATEIGQGTKVQPRVDPRAFPAQVRVRSGPKETVHKLQGEGFTAGKDDGNDLQLKDGFVSGRHVKVTKR